MFGKQKDFFKRMQLTPYYIQFDPYNRSQT